MIHSALELVTTHEKTRDGFIAFALEKSRRAIPIIEEAKTLKICAQKAKTPEELLTITQIRAGLLTAAGLSDKSLQYFTEEDKEFAICNLIENFLKPAGSKFLDELIYRYLLIKGDTLGGSMRNIVGALAQAKLIRSLLSCFSVQGIDYYWADTSFQWQNKSENPLIVEENGSAISWKVANRSRILLFNTNIPRVRNNVDISLFDSFPDEFQSKKELVSHNEKALMFGELKGGIDPAGADEHWKTARSALERIRIAFNDRPICISFIAAAIVDKMAEEIFQCLQSGKITFAINLTEDKQLVEYCTWLLEF